jgi:hypothetical protein
VLRAYERGRVKRAIAVVRMSRPAGYTAENAPRLGGRVRDAVIKTLLDPLTVAQQRKIAEFDL